MTIKKLRELQALAESLDADLVVESRASSFVRFTDDGHAVTLTAFLNIDRDPNLRPVEDWEFFSTDEARTITRPKIILESGETITIREARGRAARITATTDQQTGDHDNG